jgi:tetratricopeptide (TPR) repeat protein
LTGLYEFGLGKWVSASDHFKTATEVYQQLGDYRRWNESYGMQSTIAFFLGDFQRAFEMREELHAVSRRQNDSHYEAISLSGMVANTLKLGEADDTVMARLRSLESAFTSVSARTDRYRLWALIALAHLRRNEIPQAVKAAHEALQLIEASSPTAVYGLPGYADTSDVWLRLWEQGDASAAEYATRACRQLRRYTRVFVIGQPRLGIRAGTHAWLSHKPTQARAAWAKGLVAAQKLQMPYDEGLAHYEIGRHATQAERQTHLQKALTIFEVLGARYDAERVKGELSK